MFNEEKPRPFFIVCTILASFILWGVAGPVISFHPSPAYKYFAAPAGILLGIMLAAWSFKRSNGELGRTFSGAAFVLHLCMIGAFIYVYLGSI